MSTPFFFFFSFLSYPSAIICTPISHSVRHQRSACIPLGASFLPWSMLLPTHPSFAEAPCSSAYQTDFFRPHSHLRLLDWTCLLF